MIFVPSKSNETNVVLYCDLKQMLWREELLQQLLFLFCWCCILWNATGRLNKIRCPHDHCVFVFLGDKKNSMENMYTDDDDDDDERVKSSTCKLTIGSYVSMRSSRYEARGKFGEHERCVRASWVLSKLPKYFISRWTHSWCMDQLFYNIFNPMENFFSRWICFVCFCLGIWSTLAQLNLMRQIYELCHNLLWRRRKDW